MTTGDHGPRGVQGPVDPEDGQTTRAFEYPVPTVPVPEGLAGPRAFACKVNGFSMSGDGIFDGDWVVIDPDQKPRVKGISLPSPSPGTAKRGQMVKRIRERGVGAGILQPRCPADEDRPGEQARGGRPRRRGNPGPGVRPPPCAERNLCVSFRGASTWGPRRVTGLTLQKARHPSVQVQRRRKRSA